MLDLAEPVRLGRGGSDLVPCVGLLRAGDGGSRDFMGWEPEYILLGFIRLN
jgi:hypothetical protein